MARGRARIKPPPPLSETAPASYHTGMRHLLLLAALAACSKPAEAPKAETPAPTAAAAPAAAPAPAAEPAHDHSSEKEKALANPYPNDLGPERLTDAELAAYSPELRKGYDLLIQRCAQCHTSARPLHSRFDDSDTWNRYVKRMMNKPGCVITKAEGKLIWQFLAADSETRKKGAQAAAWKAHRERLVAEFKAKFPKRYEELKAANDL